MTRQNSLLKQYKTPNPFRQYGRLQIAYNAADALLQMMRIDPLFRSRPEAIVEQQAIVDAYAHRLKIIAAEFSRVANETDDPVVKVFVMHFIDHSTYKDIARILTTERDHQTVKEIGKIARYLMLATSEDLGRLDRLHKSLEDGENVEKSGKIA